MEGYKGTTLKLKESLTLVAVEESGALLDMEKKCCYDLNTTAFFLLKLMETGCPYESLQTKLFSEFNIDEETACCDITTFISKLNNLDCIRIIRAVNEHALISKTKKSNTLYEMPTIEYNSELAVACAPTIEI